MSRGVKGKDPFNHLKRVVARGAVGFSKLIVLVKDKFTDSRGFFGIPKDGS
jgi:hypothetical protein